MKYLSYKNYLDFKYRLEDFAKNNKIDLDLFFDSEDYICIYIKCILLNYNPAKIELNEFNNIVYHMLLDGEYLK